MSAQPKHPNRHTMGQQRRAHELRQDAIEISHNIHFMATQAVERAERCGWDDYWVQKGLLIKAQLERTRNDLIAEAKRYDAMMQDLGA